MKQISKIGTKLVPAGLQFIRKLNAKDIIQDPTQLTTVTRLPADPFISIGNILT